MWALDSEKWIKILKLDGCTNDFVVVDCNIYIYIYIYIYIMYMFTYVCMYGDQGSIPGRVIPKTPKMLLDAALVNTWHCKVWIKGKVEQFREWSSALPNTLV